MSAKSVQGVLGSEATKLAETSGVRLVWWRQKSCGNLVITTSIVATENSTIHVLLHNPTDRDLVVKNGCPIG